MPPRPAGHHEPAPAFTNPFTGLACDVRAGRIATHAHQHGNGAFFMFLPLGFGLLSSFIGMLAIPAFLYLYHVRTRPGTRHSPPQRYSNRGAPAAHAHEPGPPPGQQPAPQQPGRTLHAVFAAHRPAAPPLTQEQKASQLFLLMGILFVVYFALFA